MDNEERITMLREMPIPQLLMKMGLPTMIGMLVTGLYSIVDACFVGGLGTQQMGAISVVFPVGQILSGLGLLFGGGASSYISRLLGAGERKQANHVASTALYSSLAIGVIATLVIEIIIYCLHLGQQKRFCLLRLNILRFLHWVQFSQLLVPHLTMF